VFTLPSLSASQSPNRTNLLRLALIRFIVLTGQLAAIIYAATIMKATLNYPLLFATVALLASINTATLWRITQPWAVSETEIFIQLLIDVAALSGQLYLSGGATNPFVSYFLVPIAIAAALLSARFTWTITLLSLGSYSALLFYFQPLPDLLPDAGSNMMSADPHAHHHHNPVNNTESTPSLNLHIVGMWLNFAISAALIAFYLVRMANTVREQREQLNRQREQDLRNQQIISLATLAAGTAHELGTPLNTIQLLIDELTLQPEPDDIDLLKQQVAQCKKIIGQLTRTAELHQSEQLQTIKLTTFLQQTISNWQLLRPQVHYTLTLTPEHENPSPFILADTTLSQALCNLLNNAVDAKNDKPVEITAHWNNEQCEILIRDHGPGFSETISKKLGQPFISEKTSGQGMGLGIYLSQASIERFGGNIILENHPDGGALVTLILPITGVNDDQS